MDFVEHQDRARSRSRLLFWLFPFAAILVASGTWVVLAVLAWLPVWLLAPDSADEKSSLHESLDSISNTVWDWRFIAVMIGGSALVIIVTSLKKIRELRGDGANVAMRMGGVPINPETTTPQRKQVLNIVEEMAIASGLPVPPVFLLHHPSINAFAAGSRPENAAIGITSGFVDHLSRDEMQGVIAHEFSHIAHGDTRLNARLVGVIHGMMAVGAVGSWLRSGEDDAGEQLYHQGPSIIYLWLLGIIIESVGSLGTLCGRGLQMAVSRQREYLADAAAVDYTRYAEGIAGALRTIASGRTRRRLRLRGASVDEYAHFFFSAPSRSWMASHPPIERRIARIKQIPLAEVALEVASNLGATEVADWIDPRAASVGLETLGLSSPASIAIARELIAEFPTRLHDALGSTLGAQAALIGLLVVEGDAAQRKVLSGLPAPIISELSSIEPSLRTLDGTRKLLALDLAMPALARLDSFDRDRLLTAVQGLIQADGKTNIFEWLVGRIVLRRLGSDRVRRLSESKSVSFGRVKDSAALVLYAVSLRGARNESDAAKAFEAGAALLNVELAQPKRSDVTIAALSRALDELEQLAGARRKGMLKAVIAAATHDGVVKIGEYELVRALADALGLGLPPILPGRSAKREDHDQ